MSKSDATTIFDKKSKALSGWNQAVYDTELRIKEAETRLAKLKAVLTVFKSRRDKGEPFPGEKSEQTEAGA